MDPLSHEVSHLVVSMNGAGERQVPMGAVQTVTDDLVQLRSSSSEVMALPPFKRDDYVTLHEVEIPGLERHIHVTPGEVLVPFPELERNVKRRTFFANLTYVTGLFIGLPLVFPVLKYLDEADVCAARQRMAEDRQYREGEGRRCRGPVPVQAQGQRSLYA